MTYGEMENVWDKLNDPQLDHFLSRHDFQAILTALQDNIRAKGAGKGNCNLRTTAWPMSQNTWAETLAEIDHLADEIASPPREELHAYLAPGKGKDDGKGKGKAFGKWRTRRLDIEIEPPIFEELRQRRGALRNQLGPNPVATEVSNADYEAWRQGSGSIDRRAEESSNSSMPALLTDEPAHNSDEDDTNMQPGVPPVLYADIDFGIEETPDGRTIVHT